jgi:diadenosine tetraphosphate (Ap4A) HIT family hydrolase
MDGGGVVPFMSVVEGDPVKFNGTAASEQIADGKRNKEEDSSIVVSDCIFCQLNTTDPLNNIDGNATNSISRILYSDEYVYVIPDQRPAARIHLLVITKKHIPDCNSLLQFNYIQLNKHIHNIGELMLKKYAQAGEQTRIGYHIPPFISVAHIHLHVLIGTFRGLCSRQCNCCIAERCFPPCDCLRGKYTAWCCWYRSSGTQQKLINQLHTNTDAAPNQQYMTTDST